MNSEPLSNTIILPEENTLEENALEREEQGLVTLPHDVLDDPPVELT